jgi:undecaprenyl-diphosphatase
MKHGQRMWGVAVLGLIQGLTEFLPVSSSGHLVVGQSVFGLAPASLLLDVVLHLGTLIPILWLYRLDIQKMVASVPRLLRPQESWSADPSLRLLLGVIVGSIPTALIGLFGRDAFSVLFGSPVAVSCAFIVTGGILLAGRRWSRSEVTAGSGGGQVTPWRAAIIGVAQGMAITPGISRSGTTISVGLIVGLERQLAARLSFVMSIPAILGAALLELREAGLANQEPLVLLMGASVAALSGYIALRWVLRAVRRGELHWFSWYLWPLGISLLVYSLVLS